MPWPKGLSPTVEQLAKRGIGISKALTGKKLAPAHREKAIKSLIPWDDARRAKAIAARALLPVTEQQREQGRRIAKIAQQPEFALKRRIAQTGKPWRPGRIWTTTQREAHSAWRQSIEETHPKVLGYVETKKAGTIYYQSWNPEALLIKQWEEDETVESFSRGPTVFYRDQFGLLKRAYPDFLVRKQMGELILVEGKDPSRLAAYLQTPKFWAVLDYCTERKIRMEIVTHV